ncbi:MAG: DUF5103 domain-containing protein [Bacteroidales bacterium]
MNNHHYLHQYIPSRAGFMALLALTIFSVTATAYNNNTDFFLHGDHIHKNNISTVLFTQEDFELSAPYIRLNSGDQLILSFDDLDADYKNYQYTIIHCNADWQPSELREYEYIEGFYEDQIDDYYRSMNTRVPYTQYRLKFPNQNLQPSRSGNYILKVFEGGNRDNVVFTRRFMVFEQSVNIQGSVQQANLVMHRDQKQQLSFVINTAGYQVSNAYRDLKVVIIQNGRWDNAITGLEPKSLQGNRLVYDYVDQPLFNGGNEFRHFDIRSLRYSSDRIEDIHSSRRFWDVYLLPDRVRAHEQYFSKDDLNGRFRIMTSDAPNNQLESDYAWVHFRLPMDKPLEDGHLYVMGDLTLWTFTEKNRMNYNYGENAYELSLLLKQGYYNYLYAYLPEGETEASISYIEGNHSFTENDYTILVYHRQPGDLYDRLIGLSRLNSAINPR